MTHTELNIVKLNDRRVYGSFERFILENTDMLISIETTFYVLSNADLLRAKIEFADKIEFIGNYSEIVNEFERIFNAKIPDLKYTFKRGINQYTDVTMHEHDVIDMRIIHEMRFAITNSKHDDDDDNKTFWLNRFFERITFNEYKHMHIFMRNDNVVNERATFYVELYNPANIEFENNR